MKKSFEVGQEVAVGSQTGTVIRVLDSVLLVKIQRGARYSGVEVVPLDQLKK